jgi:peptidoglycan hydrolase CwlO-like protein
MLAALRSHGHLLSRLTAVAVTFALAGLVGVQASGAADPGALSNKIDQSKAKEDAIRAQAQADQEKIGSFQGRIDELRGHLDSIQSDLDGKTAELDSLQSRLRDARSKLVKLRASVKRDQKILADQLVAVYEAAPPDVVHVVVNAKGFSDLLEQVDQVKAIGDHNAAIVAELKAAKSRVLEQAASLTKLTDKQQSLVVTATAQRDAVAQVKLQVVNQQLQYVRSKNAKDAKLSALRDHRNELEKELGKIQDEQAGIVHYSGQAAQGNSAGYGFFQAPGTNYTVGDEPELSAKLNKLGIALHLHLIGLSGYRTPQHSIEVGGFPNDPHTKGQASDTPGVEGVSEATLNSYGLTRPFAGAAEADHIQLVGSI